MNIRLLVAVVGLGSVGLVGCGDDSGGADDGATNVVPAQKSRRGESCGSRNDCVDGLSCVQQTCIQDDFPVDPTAKECVLVQCAAQADCCADFVVDPSCADYQTYCQQGEQTYCDIYQSSCVCNYDCVDEQCVYKGQQCTEDFDCGGFVCEGGLCVECRSSAECGGLNCIGNVCQQGCTANEDCAIFNSCQGGECVETGCTSDRECILFSGRPDATCADGTCSVKCETNAECGPLHVCDGGECLFIGCETNEECRTYLHAEYTEGTAVCRDKAN